MSDSQPPDPTPEDPIEKRTPTRIPMEVSKETREEIVRLKKQGYGARRIGPRLVPSLSRDVVKRVLREEGLAEPKPEGPPQTKLELHHDQIAGLVAKRLTTTRVLREIRKKGYTGERTILAEHVAKLRAKEPLAPKKQVKRRFETAPGEEMQTDWSPYSVMIAGRLTMIHALGVLLCFSRKLFVAFFRDERQSTLFEGLARAFEYFGGCALRLVLDNMAQAVLGRIGADRKPLWHPRFAAFTKHFGTDPFACAVRDPDRKGKKEKSFRLVEDDFVRGSEFESWEDLERRTRVWLDETPGVANLRIHGTTRRVPNEVWCSERDMLIRLPEQRFAVHEDGVRIVDQDSTLSIGATRYTVPSALAEQTVAVRLYAHHFEVLDPQGHIAFSRCYVGAQDKGKLIIDPTHYAALPKRPRTSGGDRLDESFTKRFPELSPLVEGLKLKTKTLAPIHIRALLRLVDRYGEEAFLPAAKRAQEFRRFSSSAVARILDQRYPLPEPDPIPPLGGAGTAALGEVEAGSLDAYGVLDQGPTKASPPPSPTSNDDDEGGTPHGA